jgi:hypothetical protein
MRSYSFEAVAYPLLVLCAICKLGIERRFDGPVCGALRTEREARGSKDLSILKGQRGLRGSRRLKATRNRNSRLFQMWPARISKSKMVKAKLTNPLLANRKLLARKL